MLIQYSILTILLTLFGSTITINVRQLLFKDGPCLRSHYRCLNNNCIPRHKFCNLVDDCGDNSDEDYCTISNYNPCPTKYPVFRCTQNYRRSFRCIPKPWICDGIQDCGDGVDETDCGKDTVLPLEVTSSHLTNSLMKSRQWIFKQRNPERPTQKWGSSLARKAVALYLSDNSIFKVGDNFTNEMTYELSLSLLSKLALKKIDDISTPELAFYLNAFLVTCIDPRRFYVLDIVKEVRKRLDSMNSTSPFAILSLCNAKEEITESDIQKLLDVFSEAQEKFRADTQALVVLALSCAAAQSAKNFDQQRLSELTMELKKKQYRNGTVENLKTTALVMQAIFASEPESDEDNFDERKAIYQIIRSQEADGSFEGIENTYYAVPVLSGLSLVNISSEHCTQISRDENESLQNLKNQVGHKWSVGYSLWFGDDKLVQRSMTLNVPANTSFYGVMEYAAELDEKYRFKYNVRNKKPYIYALSGIMDDPESEMFWSPYYFTDEATGKMKEITKSPADIIPENNNHLVFWYRKDV